MSENEKAEKALKDFLPGDVTPEEVEMMIFIRQLLGRK